MNVQASITLRAVVFLFGVVPYWIGPSLMMKLGRNPLNSKMTGAQVAGLDNPLVVAFWVLFALWFFVWPFYSYHKHNARFQAVQDLANTKAN